jgi:hypothetical protein
MGNVSRFIEPVVLRILKEKETSYGYEIAECLAQYALTDATIEGIREPLNKWPFQNPHSLGG